MSIEAMKQALEALKAARRGHCDHAWADEAITALSAAIEAAEKQEPWNPSDTAYRPGGLPQDFIKHEVENEGDWSEWVNPNSEQYFMKCCDCGLVHKMQFKVVKYSEGDECEPYNDPNVQVVFRARRTTPPAAQRQWVGLTDKDFSAINQSCLTKLQAATSAESILKEKNT
jgi:hypothetical protein